MSNILIWSEVFFLQHVDWPEELRMDVSKAGHDLAKAFDAMLTAYMGFFNLVGLKRLQGVCFSPSAKFDIMQIPSSFHHGLGSDPCNA